jgi:hypothetical protein
MSEYRDDEDAASRHFRDHRADGSIEKDYN